MQRGLCILFIEKVSGLWLGLLIQIPPWWMTQAGLRKEIRDSDKWHPREMPMLGNWWVPSVEMWSRVVREAAIRGSCRNLTSCFFFVWAIEQVFSPQNPSSLDGNFRCTPWFLLELLTLFNPDHLSCTYDAALTCSQ